MRKGFMSVELAIILFVAGLFLIVGYGAWNRVSVDRDCNIHGYVPASSNRFNKFCSKVVNGNTILVHVDSLRNK